jgi:two-component system response regulator HydG
VRGAFTGAERDREGVFEYANGGTLFLDEIGDMPLKMQAKLLRVLETGDVVRLGSNDPRKTDVRLVSATNKDIKALASRSEFREDLLFRIQARSSRCRPCASGARTSRGSCGTRSPGPRRRSAGGRTCRTSRTRR